MRIALLSPYHGGSHAAWATGLQEHSSHQVELLSLPARFWKWRMHGAAITLARRLERLQAPDLLLTTDMLDLTVLLALTRRFSSSVPGVLYMHENQLTYPLPEDGSSGPMRRQAGERDRHYGFINLASMLAADRVVFNSEFHRCAVLEALPRFLRHFPECRELETVETIAARTDVLPIGVDVEELTAASSRRDKAPLILWNQRWEYDKNPAAFFAALERMSAEGLRFRVALCGERFSRQPDDFGAGIEALGDHVEHVGFLEREAYVRLLGRCSVVVSTAWHEFFGIAVVEAVCAGARPLLPHRLSYPDIVPEAFHTECLYRDQADLEAKLRGLLTRPTSDSSGQDIGTALRERYAWPRVAAQYDEMMGRALNNPIDRHARHVRLKVSCQPEAEEFSCAEPEGSQRC